VELLTALFAHWEDLVGREIAAHAQPRSLRDGVLLVCADQPAWATQLRYLGSHLLDRIRTQTNGGEVAEIRVIVAASTPPARAGKRRPEDGR
jgi:predicted nucleic acid-binding Zn ribbon protein